MWRLFLGLYGLLCECDAACEGSFPAGVVDGLGLHGAEVNLGEWEKEGFASFADEDSVAGLLVFLRLEGVDVCGGFGAVCDSDGVEGDASRDVADLLEGCFEGLSLHGLEVDVGGFDGEFLAGFLEGEVEGAFAF